jgi:Raf kinase inhibitor-like YbhB/YbcL family protein
MRFATMAVRVADLGYPGNCGRTIVPSESFRHGDRMAERHALEGENLSPALTWSGLPQSTPSIAVICEDPDAPSGTFVHWVGWGIEAEAGGLGEAEPAPNEGRNGFGKTGYDGPSPPPGHGTHRYFFRVYALDTEPKLDPAASKEELEAAIKGHVLASGEHMGTYER